MRKLAAVFAMSLVAGCATTAAYQAVGGSRSDGVVRLAFEYGMFENPRVDETAALTTARERCRVWGYTDAEAFGAATTTCAAYNGYGCARTMVTKEYQCTGANTPT
jgi:hypothetical protein